MPLSVAHASDKQRQARGFRNIETADGYVIAENIFQESRASFIVRACNSHDELVAALKEALDWSQTDLKSTDDITPNEDMLAARVKVLRAALKKAGAL